MRPPKSLPHAPRSSSLSKESSNDSKAILAAKGESTLEFLSSLSRSLYSVAVKNSPQIYSSDSEGEDDYQNVDGEYLAFDGSVVLGKTFSFTAIPGDSLGINQEAIKNLLQTLNRENQNLALNPRTVMASNGSIHAHPETLHSLTSFYYTQSASNQGGKDDDPTVVEFWTQFLANDPMAQLNKLPHLIIAKARACSIPAHLRGKVWQKLSCIDVKSVHNQFHELLAQESPATKLIERDIGRTFPLSDMFKDEDGVGQKMLFRVLKAYSVYDRQVEYCQGLSFCVGPLLMQKISEEEAFALLLRLMGTVPSPSVDISLASDPAQSRKFGIRSMFLPDMAGLHLALFQHSVLVQQLLPRISTHLNNCNISATMYASQWFLTLFSYSVPLELVFRVFDLIFAEGALLTLMRMSIALLKKNEAELLARNDLESVLGHLKGGNLLTVYDGNFDLVIQDAIDLCHTISYNTLEELKSMYIEQERRFAIQLTQQELAVLQDQILELQKTVVSKESAIKKLQVTASQYHEDKILIKEQLESTIREKKCLEQEANILRAQLEQAGMNLEIQLNNITDNITSR